MKSENIILFIAAFAAISALLSAGFTYYSASSFKEGMITGFASQANATVNLTISTLLSLNFTTAKIDWGSGTFNAGSTRANLTTVKTGAGSVNAVGGTWVITLVANGPYGFILENVGSVNATLNLMTGKTAATFLGGTSPVYQFNVSVMNATNAPSCLNNTGGTTAGGNGGLIALDVWTDVNTTSPGTPICGRFNFIDTFDGIRVGVHLSLPYDGFNGTLTDTFTMTYCLAPGPCT
ncbi:MAG: hypothetical protein AABX12_04955 [Nanoarchaeota archaeon]